MKKYWLIFKITWQDILQYRFNFLIHVIKYAMAVSMMSLVWLAVQKNTPIDGLTPESTVKYFFFAAILYGLSNFHTWHVEEDIKLGYLSKYLIRPYSIFKHYFAYYLTFMSADLRIKLIAMIPLLKLFGYSFLPTWWQALIFTLYLPLIFIFAYTIHFTVASFSFWIVESYSLRWVTLNIMRLLSGIIFPLHLLSDKFVELTFYLPFQHLAFTPIELILGNLSWQAAIKGMLILSFWTLIALYIKGKVWYQGVRNYESTGI